MGQGQIVTAGQRARGYHLPWRRAPSLGLDILRGHQRSFADDCAAMVSVLPEPASVGGLELIPLAGPFAIVANHLEGPGLWIGWAAALLTHAVGSVRPDPVPVHWLVLRDMDRQRVRGLKRLAPATSWTFARVAGVWSMAALPRAGRPGERASSLRALLRLALPAPAGAGRPIGIFPEGAHGSLDALRPAAAGAGSLLSLLGRLGVSLLPAAVWLEENALHARFGQSLLPTARETAASETMLGIAALLPPARRGAYATPPDPSPDTPA